MNLFCLNLFSQNEVIQSINSSGMVFNSSDLSVSTSLGQVFYYNFQNGNSMITQGFQQPYLNQSSVDKVSIAENSKIQLYPNPNNGKLNLKWLSSDEGFLEIKIFNGLGQLVYQNQNKIEGLNSHLVFDIDVLSSGLYTVMTQFTNNLKETQLIETNQLTLIL